MPALKLVGFTKNLHKTKNPSEVNLKGLCSGSYWVRTSDPLLVSCKSFLRFSAAKPFLSYLSTVVLSMYYQVDLVNNLMNCNANVALYLVKSNIG
jgi:hypothetical protein